jgi:hypothetical protein
MSHNLCASPDLRQFDRLSPPEMASRPGWINCEAMPPEQFGALVLQIQQSPGLPPITEPPRPGDVIRSNGSLCELTVTRVIDTSDGLHITTQSRGRQPHYFSACRLVRGRLLAGPRCPPGTTGGGMYPDGQQELFILERAPQQPAHSKPITPVGKAAVLAAQLSLFA